MINVAEIKKGDIVRAIEDIDVELGVIKAGTRGKILGKKCMPIIEITMYAIKFQEFKGVVMMPREAVRDLLDLDVVKEEKAEVNLQDLAVMIKYETMKEVLPAMRDLVMCKMQEKYKSPYDANMSGAEVLIALERVIDDLLFMGKKACAEHKEVPNFRMNEVSVTVDVKEVF